MVKKNFLGVFGAVTIPNSHIWYEVYYLKVKKLMYINKFYEIGGQM